jgi:hypothetical protein
MTIKGDLFGLAKSKDVLGQVTGFSSARLINLLGLDVWLLRDLMVERGEAEIAKIADDDHALSPQDRAAKEVDLLADILELERLEEAHIMAAEAAGQAIARRSNADPRAILGVDGPAPRRE